MIPFIYIPRTVIPLHIQHTRSTRPTHYTQPGSFNPTLLFTIMTRPQDYAALEIWLHAPNQTQAPSRLNLDTPLTSFKPTSAKIYAQHSYGVWQPNLTTVFVIMMSTFSHTESEPFGGTCIPLAHCPSLHHAQLNLMALAKQRFGCHVTKYSKWGHYFEVQGKNRTRTFWIKEIEAATSLRLFDFDELDGGLGDDSDIECLVVEDEGAFTLSGTFLVDESEDECAGPGSLGEIWDVEPSAANCAG